VRFADEHESDDTSKRRGRRAREPGNCDRARCGQAAIDAEREAEASRYPRELPATGRSAEFAARQLGRTRIHRRPLRVVDLGLLPMAGVP